MYDMYPWPKHAAAAGARSARRRPARAQARAQARTRATQAVQVALDRRDNGGDPENATAATAAPGAPAEPTAGRTRQ
jgi:hypothetical protein